MRVSTRGRYALRVLVDLAVNAGNNYISIREVAQRQEISLKYLEQIMPLLVRNHLVKTSSGRKGGYRLATSPEELKVGSVLRITEGSFAPVTCVNTLDCARAATCPTHPMWKKYEEIAAQFFDGISIADLADSQFRGI